jgi:hypothetical protein
MLQEKSSTSLGGAIAPIMVLDADVYVDEVPKAENAFTLTS